MRALVLLLVLLASCDDGQPSAPGTDDAALEGQTCTAGGNECNQIASCIQTGRAAPGICALTRDLVANCDAGPSCGCGGLNLPCCTWRAEPHVCRVGLVCQAIPGQQEPGCRP